MSITKMEIGSSNPVSSIHLLPCNIGHNGPANVTKYFHKCQKGLDDADIITASFRGRSILGKCVDIPDGFQGVVIKEKGSICSDQQQRIVAVDKDFKELTYWNVETKPTANDAIMNAFDWFEIANVLHSHVTPNGEEPVADTPSDR